MAQMVRHKNMIGANTEVSEDIQKEGSPSHTPLLSLYHRFVSYYNVTKQAVNSASH